MAGSKLKQLQAIASSSNPCVGFGSGPQDCQNPTEDGTLRCAYHNKVLSVRMGLGEGPKALGIYGRVLAQGVKELTFEAESQGKIEELKDPNLGNELAAARLLLASIIDEEEMDKSEVMKGLETIAKIARTAKTIAEIDAAALRQEFVDSVVNAAVFAFHRANAAVDPAERSGIFVREFASMFPGISEDGIPNIVDGEAVELNGDSNASPTETT
jgi:hypothetical protein